MDRAPPSQQRELTRLYTAARRDSANGIVAQTQKVRLRYWAHWIHWCTNLHDLDPFLTHLADGSKVDLIEGFARYVREGHAGRGHQVRVGSVSEALRAVGKTFELDKRDNPTYQRGAYKQYWEPLKQMLRAYACWDASICVKTQAPIIKYGRI